MPEFESYNIEFEDGDGSREIVLSGPPAACVAWIPFYWDMSEVPPEYKGHPWAESRFLPPPFSILFWSGNPSDPGSASNPSPASFSDRAQFLKLIESKNFRASLALDDIKLVLTESRRPISLSFKYMAEIGYTPMRVDAGSQLLTHFDRGRGSAHFDFPDSNGKELTIRSWIRFKVGRLADLGCFVLTGRRAPSAVMMLEYCFKDTDEISITFSGSSIPSQSYYLDWARESVHDMMTNSVEAINGFLEAGKCQDAPVRVHAVRRPRR